MVIKENQKKQETKKAMRIWRFENWVEMKRPRTRKHRKAAPVPSVWICCTPDSIVTRVTRIVLTHNQNSSETFLPRRKGET
jgi:hypothetical protein